MTARLRKNSGEKINLSPLMINSKKRHFWHHYRFFYYIKPSRMHDLKSRLNAATYTYNPSKPPFDKGGIFCDYTQMPNPGFDLKSRLLPVMYTILPKPLLWKGRACCKPIGLPHRRWVISSVSHLRFVRYLRHFMQKLRGARLVLCAKRKGVMQILRLLWKGGACCCLGGNTAYAGGT